MASSLSLAFDKKVYAPGDQVAMTATYEAAPGDPFTVTVTATATDPANPVNTATATGAYQVQAPAPASMTVTATDSHGGSWQQSSSKAGTVTLTQKAPPAAPVVPSGFSGTEPPAATLSAQGIKSLAWSGYTWELEDWGTAPGQPSAANVAIDASGGMVLTAATMAGNYRGAETDSARGDRGLAGNTSTWGYGTYQWVIGTDLSRLPQGLVLGLFTYWAQNKGGPAGQTEIDIEVSNWGIGTEPFWQLGFYADTGAGQTAAVPPGHCMTPGAQIPVRSAPVTTAQFTWLPGSITWSIWYGTDTSVPPDHTLTTTQGQSYDYTAPYGGNHFSGTANIPATGGQQVIANLWSCNAQVLPGSFPVVLNSFSYTPGG